MLSSPLLLLAFTASVFAQNDTYFSGLYQTLSGAGLNRLVSTTQKAVNTSAGQSLAADLPSGNKTLFAPNDNAFSRTPPSNITDPNELANILSYHVALGSWNNNTSHPPNVTVVRTELKSPDYVNLEGNKTQVLVLTNENGTLRFLHQPTPISVVSTTGYQNLLIHVVDGVLEIPPTIPEAYVSHNLTTLSDFTKKVGRADSIQSARGITIFAPTNAAIAAAAGSIDRNLTQLGYVVENHIINGTSVYSTEFGSTQYTSAGGEPFTFAINSTGTFVTSGPSTARIVDKDIPVKNGVIHVIDNILLNTQNNTDAANSAYASATSVAAQPTTETAGVGATATSFNPTGTPSSNSKNSAVSLQTPVFQWAIVSLLALTGGALVL